MGDGDDLYRFGELAIDDGKRKILKNKSSSTATEDGVSSRLLDNPLGSRFNCSQKPESRFRTILCVPGERFSNVLDSSRVILEQIHALDLSCDLSESRSR